MLELDELKQHLSALKPDVDDLGDALNMKDITKWAAELEQLTAAPGFWDDTQRSQKVLKELNF